MTRTIKKKRIPVNPLDRVLVIYEKVFDLMIQLEMVFEAQLDADRLAQAALLTLESEPKLGCRLVHHWNRPYWEPIEVAKEEIFTLATSQSEYDSFKQHPPTPYSGPQMRVCLLNSLQGAQLLIKASHQAVDAAGVKEIAGILSSNFEALGLDTRYRPEPNLKQSQDVQSLINLVPKQARRKLRRQHLEYTKLGCTRTSTFKLPFQDGPSESLTFIQRTIDRDYLESLKQYGRQHNATLNDLLISAFFRAQTHVGKWDGQRQLALNMTVDLRKHLPENRASTLTNLSMPLKYWPCLDRDLGRNFSATLNKVTTATRLRKKSYFGLDYLVYGWPVLRYLPNCLTVAVIRKEIRDGRKLDNRVDGFTNMGTIDPAWVTFGSKPVKAHLLPPAAYPPYFVLGASGYNGELSLSISCYAIQRDLSSKFLDALVNELQALHRIGNENPL